MAKIRFTETGGIYRLAFKTSLRLRKVLLLPKEAVIERPIFAESRMLRGAQKYSCRMLASIPRQRNMAKDETEAKRKSAATSMLAAIVGHRDVIFQAPPQAAFVSAAIGI